MSLENLINKDRPTKEVLCIKHNVAYTSTNYIGEHWTECPKCMIEIRDDGSKKTNRNVTSKLTLERELA